MPSLRNLSTCFILPHAWHPDEEVWRGGPWAEARAWRDQALAEDAREFEKQDIGLCNNQLDSQVREHLCFPRLPIPNALLLLM